MMTPAETERTDRTIDEIVARAPAMTAEQAARVGRLFTYIDPDTEAVRRAERIKRIVDEMPPLTEDELAKLVHLLQP
jgi:hypothetical protein